VYMKKVLDSLRLPGGVLVPMVEDAQTAKAVVQATRYPPDGTRGCAVPFVRGSAYGRTSMAEYRDQCEQDLLVMVQVESPSAVEAIPEIASIDGVDAIFLGPLDLSASLGKMGQFHDPEFVELLDRAEKSVLESKNCLLAGFRLPGRDIDDMFDKGYSLVCGSVDIGLLQASARHDALMGQKAIKKR
jgi:2-keto-3-deoxy-L-rhamnonate aldolase RhmA